MRKAIPALASLLWLAFTGCGGGGGSDPVLPPQAQASEDVKEADIKLRAVLDQCSGQVIGYVQESSGSGGSPTTPSGGGGVVGNCYNDLIVAILLWKSARLTSQPGSPLAINDPAIVQYLAELLRYRINLVGQLTPPAYHQPLAQAFIQGYHSVFIPQLQGQLPPAQLALLQSNVPL